MQSNNSRLLIVTQAADSADPILGFFVPWIREFAKHYARVEVICLREGQHTLPENVRVHSLGKERGRPLFGSFAYAVRFNLLAWRLRNEYDSVFVHMNPEYVVLGGLLWRSLGKKVGLWYTHKEVDSKLRLATLFADVVFTASPESFRLKSGKVHVMGHGIDTALFSCPERSNPPASLKAVTVGRVSAAKGIDDLIDAMRLLGAQGSGLSLDVIGTAATEVDRKYLHAVRERAEASGARVHFLGPKSQEEVSRALCAYDLFLHASRGTGSLDKAPLEAMSSGVPVVSTSEAFRAILEPYDLYAHGGAERLAACASAFASRPQEERRHIAHALAQQMRAEHSLTNLVERIARLLEAENLDATQHAIR